MLDTLRRLLGLAAPLKGRLAVALLPALFTVVAGIGLMTTSAYLIAAAALHPSVAELGVAIVGVRFFGVTRGLCRYAERYLTHWVTFHLLARLRVWFYSSLEPLAPARLLAFRSGDLLSRIVADIETLQEFYGRVILPPLVAGLVGLLMTGALAAADPALAGAWLAFYVLAGVAVPLLVHLVGGRWSAALVQARADLTVDIVDGVQGMADLIAFGATGRHEARIAATNRRLIGLQRRLAWVAGLQAALMSLLMHAAVWTMLLLAIPPVRAGRLDGVYLAALVLGGLAAFEAVAGLPAAAHQFGSSLAAARRLFHIVDSVPAVVDPPAPALPPIRYDLAVEDLTFRYPGSLTPALDRVSFTVPAGRCLALVGPSGAGKSTLVGLLARFWEYEAGSIRLGDGELRDYAAADVRRLLAVVSQQTHLFNTTIRENLLMARPTAGPADLDAALAAAQLTDFISSLPLGLDTVIGEQGLRLSGGERQRLALARAFVQDAPILILDEATAHLDALTEQALLAALRDLMRGRTTLLITHRPALLALADDTLLLAAGRVVAAPAPALLPFPAPLLLAAGP
jgi:thiol reductant ABC exporter CydC subunit